MAAEPAFEMSVIRFGENCGEFAYLNHHEQVDQYLYEQETKAQTLRDSIEADPVYRSKLTELRERIKSRYDSQHRSK